MNVKNEMPRGSSGASHRVGESANQATLFDKKAAYLKWASNSRSMAIAPISTDLTDSKGSMALRKRLVLASISRAAIRLKPIDASINGNQVGFHHP